ncbi:hypothetical protein A2Z22_00915 [Candidatus Woesebacteria bacterium RBG_16_34_12]|uniref:NYN domain-containing protein n=1 Tax=Candidatus Woesebacteria bacterium RBG_16_34_12 TaxID=1802480 RepID=A0A1F7X8S0_9BACT|nr:MAG: hypothetical protein A2Z22_00915 [Candidatus Woesebacteria bacterium RBG_16_34_12]
MFGCVLVIDGENFLHKLREVLKLSGLKNKEVDLATIDLNRLFKKPLKYFKVTRKVFYVSKLHLHPETRRKSEKLIKFQRKLRNSLIKQGFEFIIAGNVRAQKVGQKVIFREKGVDVKIAVDLVCLAADGKIKTAILCSSDSDLQPAVHELRRRKVVVIYLGFDNDPNKGLIYTTNKTILLRNLDIIKVVKKD